MYTQEINIDQPIIDTVNSNNTVESTVEASKDIIANNPAYPKRMMRDRLIQLVVEARRTNRKVTNTQLAIEAGYSPKSAPFQVSTILNTPAVKEKIANFLKKLQNRDEYISDWDLQKSIETSVKMFEKLSQSKSAADQNVAFKYKENLDKLNRLLVDRQEIIERIKYKEIESLTEPELETLAKMRQN